MSTKRIKFEPPCIYYMIRTRFVGTPFMDSLTSKQRMIKKKSANVRRTIFYEGIGIGFDNNDDNSIG